MAENKFAKVPVASHGLHRHSYNFPWLSSINFGDVMPCYYNPIRKGERDNPKAGLYAQLMPIAHNAFATGRFNFKAIFVPYKLVWRPWYNFDQQTMYHSNGDMFRPERYPFVSSGTFSNYIVGQFSNNNAEPADEDDYDVALLVPIPDSEDFETEYYHLNGAGRRVLRIIGALGCMPSFILNDDTPINILPILCYIKAFADYYFPNNYVGSAVWNDLNRFFDTDVIDFNSQIAELLASINYCSLNFYENSVFDLAWDNPVTPNVSAGSPAISISDETVDDDSTGYVSNDSFTNGTPTLNKFEQISQYMLNALKSVSMWAKRRQLSGARLLDKFLVSRGVELNNDSARISYFVGQRNVEIEVSGVENTTDVNLGELAGRGVASSGNNPLDFECRPDDDGIFFIIVSPVPDANFPVLLDGFCVRKDFLDNYNAEYDKLGVAAVPERVVHTTLNGSRNFLSDPDQENVFGFLNRYWDEVQERPRLLGDFILQGRGAVELQAYHTFRIFDAGIGGVHPYQLAHGFSFIRMTDNAQYQRLFYNEKQENLMLFLRWYGDQYKEKLPLGDSYDWDDDEFNRKVNVVIGGSQK